jgi:hypothetical protein
MWDFYKKENGDSLLSIQVLRLHLSYNRSYKKSINSIFT